MQRRPLFTTGIPTICPNDVFPDVAPEDALVVLSLVGNPSADRVHLLTLYGYAPEAPATTDLGIYFEINGGDPFRIATMAPSTSTDTDADAPVKLLDRVPCRGPVRVLAAQTADVAAQAYLWGYFELEGESVLASQAPRPLQPSAELTAPYSGGAQLVDADAVAVHQLSAEYIDLVTLGFLSIGLGGEFEDVPTITFGTTTFNLKGPSGAGLVSMFEDIPMRSALPILVSGGDPHATASIVGSFRRT